jgi:hypothetical protein
METENVIESLRNARKVSTPIVAISTADQFATMAAIRDAYATAGKVPPILQWDCARAFLPVNEPGENAITAMLPAKDPDAIDTTTPGLNLIEALTMAVRLPKRSILFVMNAGLFWDEPAVIQAVMNLRELFKQDQRTLVMLDATLLLPVQLQQDVMTFNELLPTRDTIRRILVEQVKLAREVGKDIQEPDDETLRLATEALTGLAAFPLEQCTAMSLVSRRRLDLDLLWSRKRAVVEQVPGLKFDTCLETFDDIGGMEEAKTLGRETFAGVLPPTAIIRIDEIEKHMAGATGIVADSSGTSQDFLGVILREMEDNEWRGVIAVGPPGGGKSIYSKTLGRSHNVPTLELDLNALKGSLVGQSEKNIRTAMKVIRSIAGRGAYFVATCNKLDVLPPELRRRFVHGIWFFDLPTRDELRPIWTINLHRYQLQETDLEALLELSAGWTGAEVRNVCRLAYESRKPVAAMAKRIVPVSVSDPDSIDRLRKLASGKFLSAAYPGAYRGPGAPKAAGPVKRGFMES